MSTPDQVVAERIARSIDGQIVALQAERTQLARAAERIVQIDAELAVLQSEKARIDQRRKPVITDTPVDAKPRDPRE